MKTENKPQHTQGEWKLDGMCIDAPDGSLIAEINSEDGQENQANGERIVKAVNMHDELILFIKNVVKTMQIKEDEKGLEGVDTVLLVKAKELLIKSSQK